MVLLQYVATPLLIVLLIQIIRFRAFRLFPCFTAYVCLDIVIGIVRFLVHSHPSVYFIVYWISEAVDEIFEIAVLYEVYRAVFQGLARTWWFPLIFPFTLLAAIALLTGHIFFVPIPASHRLFELIITSELGVQLTEGLMFTVLVACVALLGLRWRQYAFGITAGFGLNAAISLIAVTKISAFVTSPIFVWGWIQIGAYSGAVLIWLWYFRKPQQKLEPLHVSEEFMERALKELASYRNLLRRMRDL